MARVSDVPPEAVPPDVQDVYRRFAGGYGPFRNQVEQARLAASLVRLSAEIERALLGSRG